MTTYRTLSALTLGLLALALPSARAATATGTLTVMAQVANVCTIGNATLDFGAYSYSTGATKTTTADVTCSLLAPYALSMDQGQNASAGSNRMKAVVGGNAYYIPYTASFATSVAGILNGVGTGVAVPTLINGSAAAGANVPAATYTDSVIMTVTF